MRARAFAILSATLLAAALLAGGATFAAGPEVKKPPVPATAAKDAKGPAKKPATAAKPGKGEASEDDIIMEEDGGEGIAAFDGDGPENEGPSLPRLRRERVTAPLDLSKPMTEEPTGPPVDFSLRAKLAADLPVLPSGVVWRVFGEREGRDGRLPLLTEMQGGQIKVKLAPGSYLVHAAYGRAGATKRVLVTPTGGSDEFVLNAGGLRLNALVGKDTPIANNLLSFDIYIDDGEDGERTLVLSRVPAKRLIRLPAGTYYVISRYGETNAMVRAAIKVETGKMTDATLYHQAARVTLKLVSERGGEALANTAWSIQKPGGESVAESVGAYQQTILAAGQYTAVAKHDGKVFRTSFLVENDLNRDVEVLAK